MVVALSDRRSLGATAVEVSPQVRAYIGNSTIVAGGNVTVTGEVEAETGETPPTYLITGTDQTAITLIVDPAVASESVQVLVGGTNVTASFGPFVPGSTHTLLVPLERRKTKLRLVAEDTNGRLRDRDQLKLIIEKGKKP